jgi:glucosamine--fructose-6-phosphate aminotransferase (isomerizing)
MCGIVGFIGKNNDVRIGIAMLKRLEYRGYDCLSPDTVVQLSDGRIKTIKELELNSLVSSIDLRNLSYVNSEVKFKARKIKNRLYRIRTNHFEIKCSAEHKFFVYENGKIIEKRAFGLKKGDLLLAQKKIPIKGEIQKLPQIENPINYQLTIEGIKKIQEIRKKLKLSYSFLKGKTGVLYVADHLKGKRATTKENWQKVLSLMGINADEFLRKYSKEKVCNHAFRNPFKGEYLTPELSQIIGYIMGDGSRIDSKKDIKIKIEDEKPTLERYHHLFKKLGLKVKLLKHRHKNCWQIRLYSASFSKLLNEIAPGILDESSKREVPEIIQKSPLDCVAGFLRGLYDAEGSVGERERDGVNFQVSNEKLIKQIQLLLLRFGIISTLSFYRTEKMIRLSIYQYDSLKKFSLIIGFSSPKKVRRLQRLLRLKKNKRHKSLLLLNDFVFLTRVKTIQVTSSTHLMYDISVPKTQNFIANGLLVHNSAGLAVYIPEKKEIFCLKRVGKIAKLEEEFSKSPVKGNPFILHTRWATHGGITNENAHPHWDCSRNIFLVHNGIIENYKELKEKLIKEGHKFTSETDTEVMCHLIEKYFNGNLEEAVRKMMKDIRGTYAIAVISKRDPQKIVAARMSSPLLLGINKDEFLVASDPAAILIRTRQVISLDDGEIAVLKPNDFFILKEKPIQLIEWTPEQAEKGGYPHFMLKEIFEEPEAIENAIRGRLIPEEGNVKLGGLESVREKLRKIKRVFLVACGTSFYAAKVGEIMFQEYAGVDARAEVASEFRYKKQILDENTAAIFISQSGETADTLAALREMKKKGILCLGITNVVGSSQARETDAGVYTRSGPEVAVAATKSFLGQLAVLVMMTVFFGRQREMSLVIGKRIVGELAKLPSLAREVLKKASEIEKLAQKYKEFKNFWFIGRKYNFPIALEGALKLKEISYLHAEGVCGGELKHGPLALVDENFPTIAICPSDSVYDKMISNIQEVKARNGPVIAIATEGNEEIKKIVDGVIYIPKTLEMLTPMLTIIPLHLFAYYMAVLLGHDVDKPRNLAKSVTVE